MPEIDWTRPANTVHPGSATPYPGRSITDQLGEGDFYGRSVLDYLELAAHHAGADFVDVLRGLADLGITGRRIYHARTVTMLHHLPDVAAALATTTVPHRRSALIDRIHTEMLRRALARDRDLSAALDRWLATEADPMSPRFWWSATRQAA